jgi:hypothetical protein
MMSIVARTVRVAGVAVAAIGCLAVIPATASAAPAGATATPTCQQGQTAVPDHWWAYWATCDGGTYRIVVELNPSNPGGPTTTQYGNWATEGARSTYTCGDWWGCTPEGVQFQ